VFRVAAQSFRVDTAGTQMCSKFVGVFDLPGRFLVQSFGRIGSELGASAALEIEDFDAVVALARALLADHRPPTGLTHLPNGDCARP
jgi:hypothetical protein